MNVSPGRIVVCNSLLWPFVDVAVAFPVVAAATAVDSVVADVDVVVVFRYYVLLLASSLPIRTC